MSPSSDNMTIKTIAPWFGGKRTLAPRIARELGFTDNPPDHLVDLMCGGMALFMATPPCRQETANDLHGDLTNLAWVLQEHTSAVALYDRINSTLFSEELFKHAWTRTIETIPLQHRLDPTSAIERAYWFFVTAWAGRNGLAGSVRLRGHGFSLAVRFTNGGGSPTTRFRSAAESIPAWHDRLRNVVILRRDVFEIAGRFEDVVGTAIYADPPYPAETRSGFLGDGAHSQYLHEFNHESDLLGGTDDHTRLATILRSYRRARIVVSSYDCQRMRDLYQGWTFLDCKMVKRLHQQNGREKRKEVAPEVLIINGPSYSSG